jgi:hypothetical protein
VKARRRVVTSGGRAAAGGGKRRPTVRRIKPALAPVIRKPPVSASSIPMVPGLPPSNGSGARAVAAASAPSAPLDRDAAGDLSVDLGRGLVLDHPIRVASGTFGFGIE